MSVESAIVALLTADVTLAALVGTRVYPLMAPGDADLPLLVYQEVAETPVRSLTRRLALTAWRVRFDAFAESYSSAKAVKNALLDVLDGYEGTTGGMVIRGVFRDDSNDAHDPPAHADERGYFSAGIDLAVWYERS